MKVISLFSGAGGLDLGFVRAGHKIVWANDNFPEAIETYRLNIGNHIDPRDIKDIPSKDIPGGEILIGGFPCQGFSVANWNRTKGDPRNFLYKEMVRILRDKRPNFFLAENVKGLASMEKGEVLRAILRDFARAGYTTRHQILNAADYGVPQMRMRLLIAGVRNDLDVELSFPPSLTHAEPERAVILGLEPWVTVGNALAHFPEPGNGAGIPNHEHSKYKLTFNGYLGHRAIDPNKPAPTVTARGDERGGVVVLHHPRNHRRMTARELATVQSFPDDFVFSGPKTSAYRQIANAVPPKLAEALGKMFRKAAAQLARKQRRPRLKIA